VRGILPDLGAIDKELDPYDRPEDGVTSATKFRIAPLGSVVLPAAAAVRGDNVSVIAGDDASVTFTPTAGAATALPLLSVAMAVIDAVPSAFGVHAILHDEPETVAAPLFASPAVEPLTNTCTPVTAPSGSVAVPEMVVAALSPRNEPLAGATIATSGATPTAW
jgi:hypothetical protein